MVFYFVNRKMKQVALKLQYIELMPSATNFPALSFKDMEDSKLVTRVSATDWRVLFTQDSGSGWTIFNVHWLAVTLVKLLLVEMFNKMADGCLTYTRS